MTTSDENEDRLAQVKVKAHQHDLMRTFCRGLLLLDTKLELLEVDDQADEIGDLKEHGAEGGRAQEVKGQRAPA